MGGLRRQVSDEQQGFAGGLNVAAEEDQLAPNEIRTAVEARLTTHGAVKKRLGTKRTHAAQVGTAATILQGGFAWRQAAGTVEELVIRGGGLYSGTYAIPMVWTEKAAAGSLTNTTYPASFAAFRDATGECVYIAASGTTPGARLNKYDGTTLTTDIANTPQYVNRLAVQNQRLFGITGIDQTLWYSELNNGDTLGIEADGGGYQIVRTFGDQAIVALVALGSSLLMFHRTGISKFTGFGEGDITIASGTRGLAQDTGTVYPDSIVVVENVCYFLSDRGFYAATEFGVESISSSITPIAVVAANQGNPIKAAHSRTNEEVMWHIPGSEYGSVQGGVYVYNYRLKAWSGPLRGVFVDDASAGIAMWQTLSSGEAIVLFGKGADGFIRRVDLPATFKDDVLSDGTGGSAYTLSVRCHRMYMGNPASEKALRFLTILGDTDGSLSTVTFAMDVVSGGSGTLSATFTNQRTQRLQAWGRGQYVDVTISDGLTTAAPAFSRVTVQGVDYGERF